MQPKIHASTWTAGGFSVLLVFGIAPAALADLFGGDLPLLSGILTQLMIHHISCGVRHLVI